MFLEKLKIGKDKFQGKKNIKGKDINNQTRERNKVTLEIFEIPNGERKINDRNGVQYWSFINGSHLWRSIRISLWVSEFVGLSKQMRWRRG